MNKKLFSILFTLFLVGILSVSCSNKDKTGSGDGNSTAKYAGDWYTDDSVPELVMKVDSNGNISFPGIEAQGAAIKGIEGSGSSYTVTYSGPNAPDMIVKILFSDTSTCSVEISQEGNKTTKYNLTKKQ
ncbi:hypothetical secreted protein [Brachyspira suanatina]|uniref:Hypothetical secreted protein n=1 Tax=Brachyspira suanatina TaxID=381802 RepID=A0A0G4KAS5_9SPIR|nr:hypothetical protein [Brachyspira suanatina]CRF35583.1 hypothetical secreted protein [Brachyspira suanatina]